MIKANEMHFPVGMMCRLLLVSRSGYYAWKRRPPSVREQSNRLLAVEVKRVFDDEKGRPGAPRIARRLQDEGKPAGRHRIARIIPKGTSEGQWLAGEGGQEIQGDHQQQALIASSP